jgi:hypothetical protein
MLQRGTYHSLVNSRKQEEEEKLSFFISVGGEVECTFQLMKIPYLRGTRTEQGELTGSTGSQGELTRSTGLY